MICRKNTLISIVGLVFCIFSFTHLLYGQTNFHKYSIGGGFGPTITFADTKETEIGTSAYISADFYFTPYLTFGIESQNGRLAGGGGSFKFENKYLTGTFNARIHAGEFFDDYARKNFLVNLISGAYVGTGVGIIRNNVYIGEERERRINRDVVFPINGGINFYLKNRWGLSRLIINANIQTTISLEDSMDGDLNPYSNFNDMYSFLSVGLKYKFGTLGLTRRR